MQFVYLRTCVPLFLVCGSNFLQLGSTFCRNVQKRGQKPTGKNLNVDRQFFKDEICIFFDVNLFNLIAGVGVILILKKNFNLFALFPFINTPSRMIK